MEIQTNGMRFICLSLGECQTVLVDERVADCFVCRKHRDATLMPGGPIAADDVAIVSHVSPRAPGTASGLVYLGHLVVEPRRHAPGWADLRDDEAASLGRWCTRASRALITVTGAEFVYSASIGHRIPHLHVHLLPRYPQTPADYQWHQVDEWPEGQGTEEQAASMADRVRQAITAKP